jgi:hypothetical protein
MVQPFNFEMNRPIKVTMHFGIRCPFLTHLRLIGLSFINSFMSSARKTGEIAFNVELKIFRNNVYLTLK